MKTQLVLFVAGALGVVSAAFNAASLSVTRVQRSMLKSYFTPDAPRSERAN